MFATSIQFKKQFSAYLVFIDDPPQILEPPESLLSHEETEFTRIRNLISVCE